MAASEPPAVDRALVEKFLKTCIATLGDEATRKKLKNCSSIRPGPKIAEVQQRIWDDLGVSTQAGRQAIGAITQMDDNADLQALRKDFGKAVDAAYLRCLEDRQPSTLEKRAKMDRVAILEFLDACGVKLDTEEVQERLRSSIRETGAMPETVLNQVHGEVMELVGFEREHGQRCFAELGTNKKFAEDREVATAFARWRKKNSDACLALLGQFRKEGGELKLEDEVKNKLIEMQAKEELDDMSFDDRSVLLEKNALKVNVVRKLPAEVRMKHLEKLSDQEKLELAQCEILMSTLVQSQGWQERMAREAAKAE